MNITGIIAEYNPLHNGHVYHIESTKKITHSDGIICIMSGNFVQRGTPALLDKWTRTEMALRNGIDLVIELPLIYSISSAEFFAFGAVSLLNSLGVVNNISFGSEHGNIDILIKIAKILCSESEDFKTMLKLNLNKGLSYPVSRNNTLCSILNDNCANTSHILNLSNNILAIEYCKSLVRLDSTIVPYAVQRIGSDYNSTDISNSFASATSIRNYLKSNKHFEFLKEKVPPTSFNLIKKNYDENFLVFEDYIFNFCKYKALSSNRNSMANLPDASEGLQNRLFDSLHKTCSFEEFLTATKTKRYTRTRISRLLCQYFVGLDQINSASLRNSPAPYARVLGFNKRGTEILKLIKKSSSIPVYTKLPKELNISLKTDIMGTNTYSMLNKSISPNSDYTISPVRLLNE
jgi:predicted nucleotidyltransferase